MTDSFSEDEVVTIVTRLSRSQLVRFVEWEFVRPRREPQGLVFHPVDVARLELLCDLAVDMEMDETALGVVISLIDQLHAARQDLAAVARAIDSLPADLRRQIAAAMTRP